jgi:hypothetical protein
MASGWTNRGKYNVLEWAFRNENLPTYLYCALITNAATPDVDTNTFTEMTEINTGNGYAAGGYELDRNSTDFDVLTEDDTNDRALVQCFDIVWTASGGAIPNGGTGAYFAVLTDDNATPANREIIAYWDLTGPISVSDGQTLTLQNCELRIT